MTIKAQVFKQEPGADIEPGWYWVRQRPAPDSTLPPIPYGTPVGPFGSWRSAERNYTETEEREAKEAKRTALRGTYGHLTPEELCERLNHVRKRMGYGDTRVSFAGNGWYHRRTSGMSTTFKERRHDLEESLRSFEERERREEAERPAKEAAAREDARRRAIHLAAEDMLAALQALVDEAHEHIAEAHPVMEQARAVIAKAEGRAP